MDINLVNDFWQLLMEHEQNQPEKQRTAYTEDVVSLFFFFYNRIDKKGKG